MAALGVIHVVLEEQRVVKPVDITLRSNSYEEPGHATPFQRLHFFKRASFDQETRPTCPRMPENLMRPELLDFVFCSMVIKIIGKEGPTRYAAEI